MNRNNGIDMQRNCPTLTGIAVELGRCRWSKVILSSRYNALGDVATPIEEPRRAGAHLSWKGPPVARHFFCCAARRGRVQVLPGPAPPFPEIGGVGRDSDRQAGGNRSQRGPN
jgi:hypothetical protein